MFKPDVIIFFLCVCVSTEQEQDQNTTSNLVPRFKRVKLSEMNLMSFKNTEKTPLQKYMIMYFSAKLDLLDS